jgi:hypothetical protein
VSVMPPPFSATIASPDGKSGPGRPEVRADWGRTFTAKA